MPFIDAHCPYCGESIALFIDDSVERQRYVEDCQVCCRPMEIAAQANSAGEVSVVARAENDV